MTTSTLGTRRYGGLDIPGPGTFTIDPIHTTVGFVARHLMVSKVRGSFATVGGVITIAADPLASEVRVTIGAASITTGAADRDNHLRSADFLDVDTYPTITFRSSGVRQLAGDRFAVTGELAIRNVTRPVELEVEFSGVVVNPWGQEVIGFTATTEINREEFGITWNRALEAGGVLVGPKVRIEIAAEAKRES